MLDVVALGEVLIDFTPAGKSVQGNFQFERNPGGAPANVVAALSRLGRKTAFIGKVGQDQFGAFLIETLSIHGVDVSGMVSSSDYDTTLAFVHLDDAGDRSFSFYRNPGADQMLRADEVDLQQVERAAIFHFGSVSMTHEPAASTTLLACKHAKQHGAIISFDPNLRVPLWPDLGLAKTRMMEGLALSDIVKISEEELLFLTGTDDLEAGSLQLYEQFGIPVLLVTRGKVGCYVRRGMLTLQVSGYQVDAVDTTGAGDGFLAGFLHQLLDRQGRLNDLTEEELRSTVQFANAVGALVTTQKGAIPAMPTQKQVEELIEAT